MTTKTTEPEPCPECRGVAGRDCEICDGVGFKRFNPPRTPKGPLFPDNLIPDVEPPALPKK